MKDWYYYYQLDDRGRILYDRILDAIKYRHENVSCDGLNLRLAEVSRVMRAVECDNPHLFYVNFKRYQCAEDANMINVYSISLMYLFSNEDCNTLQSIVDKNLKRIISKLSVEGASDYQKVLKLHDLLSDNVNYFSEALCREGSFEWYRSHTILGVLLDKKAVCSGTSMAFKYILNMIGVRSIVVIGTALNDSGIREGHAWNIVKIDGCSYHVDMTWDIANSNNGLRSYNYFNLDDRLICKDHYPDGKLPVCCSDIANYFARNGYVIHNKTDWVNYFKIHESERSDDYYVRIDYECELSNEIKRIEEYIKSNVRSRSIRWRIIADERQKIIRVIAQG